MHERKNNKNPAKSYSAESKKGIITPLDRDDIEDIAHLSQKYFPRSKEVSIQYLKKTLCDLYFNGTDSQPNVTSLVSRSKENSINGFLGVTTQTFFYKKKEITVANCHHLMATDEARSQLIPIKMLQKFISGPQELSFSDGSAKAMHLFWKRFGGGESSVIESIYYKIPLRPVSFAMRPLLGKMNRPLSTLVSASAAGIDKVAGALRIPMFYRNKPGVQLKKLTSILLLEGLQNIQSKYSIFPSYDQSKIEHLFKLLNNEKRYGTFYKIAVLEHEKIVGWFIYYAKKGGVCEVLQAISLPGKEEILFDMITWHAFSCGGVELSGRLMAHHLQTSFTSKAICIPARMWTLIHSSNKELKHDIQTGNAFLTRFEGDLWLL
ncbi:MAG: hypothetical protein WD381_04730 [Balneolaceae bacterium]